MSNAALAGAAGIALAGALMQALDARRWRPGSGLVRRVVEQRGPGIAVGFALGSAGVVGGQLGLVPAGIAAGGFVAFASARLKERRARLQARRALPSLAGGVAAALAAGLAPIDALSTSSKHREDPLGRAVRRACSRIEAGAPVDEALGRLVSELPDPRLAGLCTALAVASRSGTDAVQPVKAIAAAARSGESMRMKERSAKAAPAIQLVIALGMVPSVLMLVAACLLAAVAG